jgi:hypothetical protein
MASVRESILAEASTLTAGDRNKAYGEPHDNLTFMARLVSAYLFGAHKVDLDLDSEDMAWIMLMAKVSRTDASFKLDNYIDASAYAAIAGECRNIINGAA